MKSPNTAEVSEQFRQQAVASKQVGDHSHSGFCLTASARCEEALGTSSTEAERYVQAAQSFVQAEMEDRTLNAAGFHENINEAIKCYERAIEIYCRNKRTAFAATLCMELANALLIFDRVEDAIRFFDQAASLFDESPLAGYNAHASVLQCNLKVEDYEGALLTIQRMLVALHNVLTEYSLVELQLHLDPFLVLANGLPCGSYRDSIGECEVTALLLLLLLPPAVRQRQAFQGLLLRYEQVAETNPAPYLRNELFFNLQSLALSVALRDIESLRHIQARLWPELNASQNELVHHIVALLLE